MLTILDKIQLYIFFFIHYNMLKEYKTVFLTLHIISKERKEDGETQSDSLGFFDLSRYLFSQYFKIVFIFSVFSIS